MEVRNEGIMEVEEIGVEADREVAVDVGVGEGEEGDDTTGFR